MVVTPNPAWEERNEMKFTKEFLKDSLWKSDAETIYNIITGHGRWSVHHERVFRHDGKFYLTTYSVGATESQDESPYEYDDDEIECVEVHPIQVEVTKYVPVTEPSNA